MLAAGTVWLQTRGDGSPPRSVARSNLWTCPSEPHVLQYQTRRHRRITRDQPLVHTDRCTSDKLIEEIAAGAMNDPIDDAQYDVILHLAHAGCRLLTFAGVISIDAKQPKHPPISYFSRLKGWAARIPDRRRARMAGTELRTDMLSRRQSVPTRILAYGKVTSCKNFPDKPRK